METGNQKLHQRLKALSGYQKNLRKAKLNRDLSINSKASAYIYILGKTLGGIPIGIPLGYTTSND